jgi:hypothetical protein
MVASDSEIIVAHRSRSAQGGSISLRPAANVGLRCRFLPENLAPFWLCLRACVCLLLGRYNYQALH